MTSNLVLFQILRGKEGNSLFIRSPKTNSVIAVNLYTSCTLLLEESQFLRMVKKTQAPFLLDRV